MIPAGGEAAIATTIVLFLAWITTAIVAAAVCVSGLAIWADRSGLHDRPNHRRSHVRPVPRIGGLAIVLVTVVAALAGMLLSGVMLPAAGTSAAILLPAVAIAAVSLADDIRGIPIGIRFGVHVAAAAAVATLFGPLGSIEL